MRAALDFIPRSRFRVLHSRRGVTLIEVLIAMFVMAIGLMGMLALFPMGMLQMAQAVKDERTTQTAKIMEGYAKFLWRDAWTNSQGLKDEQTQVLSLGNSPELIALDNPSVTTAAQVATYLNGPSSYQTDRLRTTPSSPVFIDPIGYAFQPAASTNWVGGVAGVLPRRSISTITSISPGALQNIARMRLCCLLDDLTFDVNGLPANPITRASDYNAGWLIQRAKNNVRTEINLQIVVYRRRPPTDTFAPETPINNVTINPGQIGGRQIGVNFGGVPAPKPGTWLLLTGAASGSQEAFADFYRVIGVQGNAPNFVLEFAQPIKSHAQGSSYSGVLIQMENVAEVFDKGTLSIYDRPTE